MTLHEVLSRTIQFSNNVFEEYRETHTYNDTYSMVVVGLYRRIIELSDGLWICSDHGLKAPTELNYRGLMEAYLAFKYIINDEQLSERRAIAYRVGYHMQQIEAGNYALNRNGLTVDKRARLNTALANHQEFLNQEDVREVVNEWNRLKQAHPQKHAPKWHSLYSGPSSINALARHLSQDMTDRNLMSQLYSFLSVAAHNYLALRDYRPTLSGEHFIMDVRYTINEEVDEFSLIPTRAILLSATLSFCQHFFPTKLEHVREFVQDISEYLVYE